MDRSNQKAKVKALVDYLSEKLNVTSRFHSIPDELERRQKAVDGLYLIGNIMVAIEHTTLDSVPNQRRQDARFRTLSERLKAELSGKLPSIGAFVLCIGDGEIPTGQDWNDLRNRIAIWCIEKAPSLKLLKDRSSSVREQPVGVPLELALSLSPFGNGELRIARFTPSQLESLRDKVMEKAIAEKGQKFPRYKAHNNRTILLIESDDWILADPFSIRESYLRISQLLPADKLSDDVFLVYDIGKKNFKFYPLKLNQQFFPHAIIDDDTYVSLFKGDF